MNLHTLIDGYAWLRCPYNYLDRRSAQEGLTFFADLPVVGRVLLTGDPDLIREVITHPDLESGKGITALREILGEQSLIMLDGAMHARHRRQIAPFFQGPQLGIHDQAVLVATRQAFATLPKNQVFSLYDVVLRITLKLIIKTIFGDLPDEDETMISVEVERFLNSFTNPLILFAAPFRIDLGSLSPWGRALRNRDRLIALIRAKLELYRKSGGGGILDSLVHPIDQDQLLGDEEIACEILALLMFGHDTAASALCWAFTHIYQHRETTERIKAEWVSIDAPESENASNRAAYLQACLNESLRMTPVVVHVTRVAKRDTAIGERRVMADAKIFPCMYLAHRNPDVFVQPTQFIPERFLENNKYEYSFFPFGLSSRICVGRPYALRQMMFILGTALTEFELELAGGYQPRPVRRLVLIVPAGGTRMVKRN